MESRAIRRSERRKSYRRTTDRIIHGDIVDMFHAHLEETSGGFERLESVEDTVRTLDERFDRVETRLNMILGGIAVVGFIFPIAATLMSR